MILINCNCENDFHRIVQKWKINCDIEKIVIATVDAMFFHTMKDKFGYSVELLDVPFDSEKIEALKIIEYLNMAVFDRVNKKYLYEIGMHIEGSGIEQTVADIIGECEKYSVLLEKYGITEVYVCCDEKNVIDVEVLRLYAKEKHIQLKICYSSKWDLNDWKQFFYCCSSLANRKFKCFYYFCNSFITFLRAFLSGKMFLWKKNLEEHQYECGRIWFSYAIKHYNWGKCKLSVFNHDLSFNVICVDTQKEVKQRFTNSGISAMQLEDAGLCLWSISRAIFSFYIDLVKLHKGLKRLCIDYADMNLAEIVKFRIWQHVLLDVPHAIIVDEYARNYFAHNSYKYIEAWLGSNSIYTRIFHHHTRNANTVFFRVYNDIYSINYSVSKEVENGMIDVLFIGRNNVYNIDDVYKKNGWNGKCYFLSNTVKNEKSDMEINAYKEKIKILWAPSYPLRGIFSARLWEQINAELFEGLIDFDAELYVKYHINQDSRNVMEMYQRYSSVKVHFVGKEQAIEKCLSEVDIVITTPSLVVFDAMKLNKPVFVIRMEGMRGLITELNFLEYKSVGSALDAMETVIVNEAVRKEQLRKQIMFVREFLDVDEEKSYHEIAALLRCGI